MKKYQPYEEKALLGSGFNSVSTIWSGEVLRNKEIKLNIEIKKFEEIKLRHYSHNFEKPLGWNLIIATCKFAPRSGILKNI